MCVYIYICTLYLEINFIESLGIKYKRVLRGHLKQPFYN